MWTLIGKEVKSELCIVLGQVSQTQTGSELKFCLTGHIKAYKCWQQNTKLAFGCFETAKPS
jgi:hypothetical protein